MNLQVFVDYKIGTSIPDGKTSNWALKWIRMAQGVSESNRPTKVGAGNEMMIYALRYWAKKLKLETGFITLHYVANGKEVQIDSHGSLTSLSGLDDENLFDKYLMELL